MRILNDLSQLVSPRPTVLTLGMFDGVHLGHQALIRQVVQSARADGCIAALVTFTPHPAVALRHAPPCEITPVNEKLAELEQLGLDQVVMIAFTPEFAQTRAAEFARRLVDGLNMHAMWIGYDFAMGYRREGDAAFLQRAGAQLGFSVRTLCDPVLVGGQPVSSSRIRAALKAGDMQQVNACLGRRFRLCSSELANARYDCSHGILSAEMPVFPGQAIPGSGVYACQARIGRVSRWMPAILDLNKSCRFNHGRKYFKIYLEMIEGDVALDQFVTVEVLKNLRSTSIYDTARWGVARII